MHADNRPNHLFIHPRIFTKADGPRTSKAKALAFAMIKQLNLELLADSTTEQEKSEVREEMDNLEVFSWLFSRRPEKAS